MRSVPDTKTDITDMQDNRYHIKPILCQKLQQEYITLPAMITYSVKITTDTLQILQLECVAKPSLLAAWVG